jgi:esterase/lipase superfamily enzyme
MQIAREVLLYIHGYTVSYNSALKRAAQLKNDLKFEGTVILYSWPTMGQPLAYHRDGRMIKRTAHLLREFILIILREV